MLSSFVIAFILRSKYLNFMALVTVCSNFGVQENKTYHCFHIFPTSLPSTDGTRCQLFHSSFTLIKRFFSSPSLSAVRVVSSEVTDSSPGRLDSSL